MKHFELTDETTEFGGIVLHRIRALVDLPQHGVKAGDLGGWVEHEGNLDDTAWIADEAKVYEDARVFSSARVFGHARVADNAKVSGNAEVSGRAQVSGNARVFGHAMVFGHAEVFDDAEVFGHARVAGNARVFGNAMVFGNALVFGNAEVFGSAEVFGNAAVFGNAKLFGDAEVFGRARVACNVELFELQHILNVGPIGSENHVATLARTRGGGHLLTIGCWTGTIDELPGEVDRRAALWLAPDADTARWRAEYAALVPLLRARVRMWEAAHA